MRSKAFDIHGIPSLLIGEESQRVYLFIHGQCGCKEEALDFAGIACHHGWQVLSCDLPEHGARKDRRAKLLPWVAVEELSGLMAYAKGRWARVAMRANSIGAWLGMLSFQNEAIEKALLVSPVVDMALMIEEMMARANVSREQLEKEGEIATDFGQTLSWPYYLYAREHPIERYPVLTHVLYGGKDDVVRRSALDDFVKKSGARLTIMQQGEHWFHTPQQLRFLDEWTKRNV